MKLPNINLDEKTKKLIIKAITLLIGIIVLFAFLSNQMTKSGKTLAEYAAENPELAYGTFAENEAMQETLETKESNTYEVPESTESSKTTDSLTEAANVMPDRIIYQPDFYYESLSSELCDRITGISYPATDDAQITYEELCYIHVLHYDFSGEICEGELISNKTIATDLMEIFYELYKAEYQIEKIALIDDYNGDDTASMQDNNTSCFNYRYVDDTDKLSMHALGLAIDINPLYNPYVRFSNKDGQIISPIEGTDYADRTKSFPYKIDTEDLCYRLFIAHGFTWGGNWNSVKDYQHFQKKPE